METEYEKIQRKVDVCENPSRILKMMAISYKDPREKKAQSNRNYKRITVYFDNP